MRIKRKISKEQAAQAVTRAIIDDGEESFKKLIDLFKKHRLEIDSLPDSFTEENIKDFTIFIFFLEFHGIKNLFDEQTANDLREFSIDYLSKELNLPKRQLLRELTNYEKRFDGDVQLGIDPFNSFGVMAELCEKLGFKKTVNVRGTKWFSPILTTAIGGYLTGLTGRWKKIKTRYKII